MTVSCFGFPVQIHVHAVYFRLVDEARVPCL